MPPEWLWPDRPEYAAQDGNGCRGIAAGLGFALAIAAIIAWWWL